MAQLAAPSPAGRRGRRPSLLWIPLALAVIYLVLPLLATVAFSLATVWSRTILPQGWTFAWFRAATADDRFWPTTMRTLQVTAATAVISPLIVSPALLYVHLKAPRWKPWLEFLSIVPWALPGVVVALAMIRAYIAPFNVNKPLLLVFAYVLLSLPFMFRSIDAALSATDMKRLMEAGQMLGAGWGSLGRRVIVPNIMPGVLSGVLLVAALAAGEFALASLMVGSGWKTFPVYQAQTQGVDGRIASALAVMGIVFTWVISMGLIFLSRGRRRRGAASLSAMANK